MLFQTHASFESICMHTQSDTTTDPDAHTNLDTVPDNVTNFDPVSTPNIYFLILSSTLVPTRISIRFMMLSRVQTRMKTYLWQRVSMRRIGVRGGHSRRWLKASRSDTRTKSIALSCHKAALRTLEQPGSSWYTFRRPSKK